MIILGLNYVYHDTSACIVSDGNLLVALEEERFTRSKHTSDFPRNAIDRCFEVADVQAADVDHIAVSFDPRLHAGKRLVYAAKLGLQGIELLKCEFLRPHRQQKIFWRWYAENWPDADRKPTVHFIDHHRSHIAGSFFVSPYEKAALLSIDGSGEWSTHWMGEYDGTRFVKFSESFFPHSLGAFYEAATEFCGFRTNYDEGKTMGLAPFGDPEPFFDTVNKMVDILPNGEIRMDLSWFEYQTFVPRRTSRKFVEVLGEPRQMLPTAPFEKYHENVAASFQKVLEEKVLEMCRLLERKSTAEYLVIAGGVSLNSVMNGRILRETRFKDVYVMPAAGDNGTSIGAAYVVWNEVLGKRTRYSLDNPFLGTGYGDEQIEALLKVFKLDYVKSGDVCADAAKILYSGQIIGWFQGRMEIGPRALGSRSILADPTSAHMKQKINAEVKYREPYRPFAPSSTAEAFRDYFEVPVEDPFMLKVGNVRPEWRERLAAITHVDGSARLQTVNRETNPLYHQLLTEFGTLSGVEVLLNTSFNVMGEPVVESPEQAIRCFYSTGLDALVIGSFIVRKDSAAARQP
ncbi:MAG: carbamoyltransferase C-terminal domain-containing protein [Pseudohongiella sp.]|uniref:carbamoyltransferase n=1 Tax=Pseudohongiella sp. TaxID=1979412 RepID=UPI0034A095FF